MVSQILSHPQYSKTVSNLERTVVRDKLARLVQYFSRFLSYYAYRKGFSAEVVSQLKAISGYFSLSRKIFRLGKPIGLFRAVIRELSNHTGSRVKHYANLGRNVGQFGFLGLDGLILLQLVGAHKFKPAQLKTIQTYSNRFWLLSMVSNIVDAAYSSYVETLRIRALSQDVDSSDDEFKLATTERKKQLTVLIWNIVDTVIPSTALGLVAGNDGICGLAGTFTSYLGLLQAW